MLTSVENAKSAKARDDFAIYRQVIRREMLWDWWPQCRQREAERIRCGSSYCGYHT